MGCDIHVFIERKDEKNEYWKPVNLYRVGPYSNEIETVSAYDGRDYELFSVLAGVRGSHEPLEYPRGLPSHMSSKVLEEYDRWETDAHTCSWYDFYELKLYVKEHKGQEDEYQEGSWNVWESLEKFYDRLVMYCDMSGNWIYNLKPNQFRVVFWFDS